MKNCAVVSNFKHWWGEWKKAIRLEIQIKRKIWAFNRHSNSFHCWKLFPVVFSKSLKTLKAIQARWEKKVNEIRIELHHRFQLFLSGLKSFLCKGVSLISSWIKIFILNLSIYNKLLILVSQLIWKSFGSKKKKYWL